MTADALHALPDCLDGGPPIAVRTIELERLPWAVEIRPNGAGIRYTHLLALVRHGGRPVGWTSIALGQDGRAAIPASLAEIAGRRAEPSRPDPVRTRRAEWLVSVVVATCGNAPATLRCVAAILASGGEICEVIVVENRPHGSSVAKALRGRFGEDPRVRYTEEHRAGLSSARNAGLREARGEIVAFTDDDVTVDADWITALRDTFALDGVDCVTGLIAPLELETPAQILIERFAGYGKGFQTRRYALADAPADEPLFPYAAGHFVSGANIAFHTETLRALGGFDPALGTGTPARGCEDLDICIRLLLAGGRLVYEPRATVWHRHPSTASGAHRRVFDYGTALGALLMKHLAGPNRAAILAKAPRGAWYFLRPGSRKNAGRAGVPKALRLLELAGVLYGPIAYMISRVVTRG
jgi:GT2 family glycosyltransferase